MSQSLVLFEVAERIATLTLNHPEKRNALSRAMLTTLHEHLHQLASRKDVRVVVLRAAGSVFSSGHDLRELAGCTEAEARSLFALCTEVMLAIRELPQPVIAQVQGLATAAGCQLAATCDLVVAAEAASFATPGVKIGLFCTTPGVALARAVTSKKALEMLLTGTPLRAPEAERAGLVNRVVPTDRLAAEARQLAQQIAQASGRVVALGKRAYYDQLPLSCSEAYAHAQPVMTGNAVLADAQEGIRAFLEKRPASWPD
ncbi:MAG: enoyl-CoA hydratase [Planctomycetia bacterium]|nr:enoyl-CoA hydratase [Planctomycetia bacterium]